MMEHETSLTPGRRIGRWRTRQMSPGSRFLWSALLLSVCVHAVAILLFIYMPRFLTREKDPQEQGTVELLMVEQKGAQPSQAGQPNHSKTTHAPSETVDKPTVKPARAASKTLPAPSTAQHGDEPALPPTLPKPPMNKPDPPAREAEAQPVVPPPEKAPVFDLEGTGSESNAIVLGGHVLPAMPDDKFRNRPPLYPAEAAMQGQHGAVVVMIHVSARGLAISADVVESSGVAVLDQAAVAAVLKWHFHPAMKDGQTVPSTMPFRFVFQS